MSGLITGVFPGYRDRYLPAMTLKQIAALPDKTWAPVVITTGAIEQHGPHLPVAVDALMGQVWLSKALPLLPSSASCYIAPPITIGKSNEHTGFPGTLSISKETLRELLLAIARQVHRWGFRQMAILNTHGGNLAVIGYALREIRAQYGLRCGLLAPAFDLGLSAQEKAFGFHANTAETAWLLAAAPQYVKMADAVCEYCGRVEDPGELRPERAPATMAWVTSDLSKSGVMGDATAATRELGMAWIHRGAELYAAAIAELAREGRRAAGLPLPIRLKPPSGNS
jgi:creatinine amidohydrolase